MSDTEIECQNHANCGDYCETPREIEMVLCEDCLDSYDMRERERVELKALRASVPELVEALTKCVASLDQLLPYLAKVPADIGLLNDALISARAALSAQGGE